MGKGKNMEICEGCGAGRAPGLPAIGTMRFNCGSQAVFTPFNGWKFTDSKLCLRRQIDRLTKKLDAATDLAWTKGDTE